jgi:hypothetical protein
MPPVFGPPPALDPELNKNDHAPVTELRMRKEPNANPEQTLQVIA